MPTFQTYRGNTFFAPVTIIDVQNELVAPSALGKSLAIFGDFPELESGKVYTSVKGGAQIADLYHNVSKIRNYDKLWRQSLNGVDNFSDSLSFINCGTTAQAGVTVDDSEFKARYYGVKGNQARVRIETPSTGTSDPAGIGLSATTKYYRVLASAPGYPLSSQEFGYPNQLKVVYTDDNALDQDATIVISAGSMVITTSAGSTTIDMDELTGMDDLQQIIEATDSRFAATVLNYDVQPKELDEGTYTFNDDTAVNTPQEITFHAHVKALEEGLERLSTFPVKLELGADRYRALTATAGDADAAPLNLLSLTGGSQSDATTANFRSVLESGAIIGKDFTSCTIESTTAGVHKLLKDYCTASEGLLKERNAYVAAPSSQSLDSVYNLYVLPLNDSRVSVVAQDIVYEDYQGNRKVGNTIDMAVLMMCSQGALGAAIPLTQKKPNILDTKESWSRDLDIHDLAKRSILGIHLDSNNQLSIIRGLTSHAKDNLLQNIEISSKESIDTNVRDLRAYISQLLGSTVSNTTKGSFEKLMVQRLSFQRERGIIKDFKNIQVSISGDTATASYDVQLTNPLNFIRINATILN